MQGRIGNKLPVTESGNVKVYMSCENRDTFDLYMQLPTAIPTLAQNLQEDDTVLNLDTSSGISVGDAVYIAEGTRHFQSVVSAIDGNAVTILSPIDYPFTSAAAVRFGKWKINVDGTTQKVAYLYPPPNASMKIRKISIQIDDESVMDSSKFGGISSLTKGILFRVSNGHEKNLYLIVNNAGMSEFGFDINYDQKAPAGVYSIRADKRICDDNGTAIELNGNTDDALELYIRDDLTDLTKLTVTVSGHVEEL